MFGKTSKAKINPWGDVNLEKARETPAPPQLTKQLSDLINPASMLDQIFGSKSGEKSSYGAARERDPRPHAQENLIFSYKNRREDVSIQKETAYIVEELKRQITHLEKSEKALTKEISKVKLDKLPPKASIYYLRFFEWLISVVRQLRQKVEDGRAWLAAFNQKKQKKMGYWKMYKKHGTTFGMSHERTLATQTG